MGQEERDTLLQFFKALANENRLRILGLLANRECSVEELATLLDLKPPTVSHHLGKLKALGLVDMRVDGNDHLHRLNVDSLQAMNRSVFTSLTAEKMTALIDSAAYDPWERKVLGTFLEGDQIRAMPMGYKKRLAVLKWLADHFEEGERYPETAVNEIITRHYHDYCLLRRELVDNGLMERENGIYWRVEWQMPDLA